MPLINSQLLPTPDQVGLLISDQLCDASVYVGALVYIEGGTAFNGLADDMSTSKVIGIVEDKSSTTTCDIRIGGLSDEIFTGLDDNNNYFLSPSVAGGITLTAPNTSNHVVVKIGNPITDKIMLIGIEVRAKRS